MHQCDGNGEGAYAQRRVAVRRHHTLEQLGPPCLTSRDPLPPRDVVRYKACMNSKLLGALFLLSCSSAASAQAFQGTSWTESSSCVEHLPPSAFSRVAVSAYVDLRDSVSAVFAMTADNFMQDLVTTTQRQLGMTGNKLPVGEPAVNWRGGTRGCIERSRSVAEGEGPTDRPRSPGVSELPR